MQPQVYRMIAMLFRYWLVILTLIILWRAIKWLYKERAAYQATLRVLPDAGFIGELVDLDAGISHPLPREGFISGKRQADIGLKGLPYPIHFELMENEGILIEASKRLHAKVDEVPVGKNTFAFHGTILEAGTYRLRFRLFEGVPVPEMQMEPSSEIVEGSNMQPLHEPVRQMIYPNELAMPVVEEHQRQANEGNYVDLDDGFCLDNLQNKTPSSEPWGDEEWTDGQ